MTLHFQTIKKGMTILGCITEVHEEKLIISLPNLVQGYVTSACLKSMYNDPVCIRNKETNKVRTCKKY